ncbi:hypothetical protein Mpet_1531 [Methanolacinia petrolearia DSM 11571]|uniref:Trypsin-co-occurring domain-containing protein n=1 Tax=Methanolacinia petrolearia (strain DSM 11571 / OCM 486 / SEBR 4847) TaxID=679926 RepID=E1RG53_METP4|nr:CU044_2847 family protein [Methanolacinia petrolearia]ADN36288.1 hypothetical protein Mpet_1531 [Methanolacinia petrolearia DSM 11571]
MPQNDKPSIIFGSVITQLKEEEIEEIKEKSIPVSSETLINSTVLYNRMYLPKVEFYKKAEDLSEKALDDSLTKIGYLSEKLNKQFEGMVKKPNKVEVSFGLKVSGGIALFVEATGSCEFAVKLTWESKS